MSKHEIAQLILTRKAEGFPTQFANGLATAEKRLHETEVMMRERGIAEASKPVRFRTFAKPAQTEV